MKRTVSFLALLAAVTAVAEKQPYDRYQSIVDRQMFGPLPPGFDPTKSPSEVQKSSSQEEKQLTQEQEKLQSSIHFSVINVTPEGDTAVGFTDNSDPKAPVHYYLKVGEKRNGWEVKEADAAAATMTIAKGDIEVSLSLGGNSAKDAGSTAKAGAQSNRPGPGAGLRSGLLGGSLRARRQQRLMEAKAAQEKEAAAKAEKEAERQAQAEQEKAQREAERAEQRQQLQAIQEELKRVREAKAKSEQSSDSEPNENN